MPIRLELGPKDLDKASTLSVRRDTGAKASLALADIATSIPALLETIHNDMLSKARATMDAHMTVVTEWKDFVRTLNNNHICVIPWCEEEACEDAIKERSAKECANFSISAILGPRLTSPRLQER